MSETTLQSRKYHYELTRRGLCDFIDDRNDEGEKKYGVGRRNAGYRRDNLMDIIEEVTDALRIFKFFFERAGKTFDAASTYDVRRMNDAVTIYNTLFEQVEALDKLREFVDDHYPQLLREDVKRLVALPPQPGDRKE